MSVLARVLIIGAAVGLATMISQHVRVRVRRDESGWKQLRPGFLVYFMLFGCASFVVLAGSFLLTADPTRPDAQEQNFSALLVLIGFAIAGAYPVWIAYGRRVKWKSSMILVRSWTGKERMFLIPELVSMEKRELSEQYRLIFQTGEVVRFSANLRGATQLILDIEDYLDSLPFEGQASSLAT
ncbi:hypothetical protein [uncultured Sphingomonas sp.]|uniref:hypothetical protein n=1 Tax=uncultured Sphingomonas sp. TaxID=158754 RepID=UPI0025DC065E|nr:hypothetical protein [uncultured Sphingomonas sp.]